MFKRYRFAGCVGVVSFIVLAVPSLVLAAQLHITGVHVDENAITIMGQDFTLPMLRCGQLCLSISE